MRDVWANGWTNSKHHHSNKEPYSKKCNKCGKKIWMNPVSSGWQALEASGKKHECKTKKSRSKSKPVKSYRRNCNKCNQVIVMKMINKKWRPLEQDEQTRHRCPGMPKDIKDGMNHMKDI